jgi:2-methylcitrate dehydratase PrpD
MQPGFSARSAVLSAALASRGVTGATNIFEGEYGFYNLYERGKVNAERATENLGDHFGVMDLSIKPYPSCRMTHASIDAALELHNSQSIDPEAIAEILVCGSKMVSDMVGGPFEIRTNPQVDAQFSIPYTVAVALTRGKVLLGDFSSDTITKGTSALELAKKIKVVTDPQLPANDISSANMTIRMVSGETLSSRVDGLKGSPSKPMSFDECAAKFRHCLEYSGKQSIVKNADTIIDLLFNLETRKDVGELFDVL